MILSALLLYQAIDGSKRRGLYSGSYYYNPGILKESRSSDWEMVLRSIPPQASVAAENQLCAHLARRLRLHPLPFRGQPESDFIVFTDQMEGAETLRKALRQASSAYRLGLHKNGIYLYYKSSVYKPPSLEDK